jgi:hypothetical protein
MIAKDYFKRQATTLRKMVRVTRNPTIADRLSFMAEDFEHRSADGTDEINPAIDRPDGATNRDDGNN